MAGVGAGLAFGCVGTYVGCWDEFDDCGAGGCCVAGSAVAAVVYNLIIRNV